MRSSFGLCNGPPDAFFSEPCADSDRHHGNGVRVTGTEPQILTIDVQMAKDWARTGDTKRVNLQFEKAKKNEAEKSN
jgi:hypothetical protein